jgi:hypothetical protein
MLNSGPKSTSIRILSFIMKVGPIATICLQTTFFIVTITSPRIPPFVGYFLCRCSQDWFGRDVCGFNDHEFHYLPVFRGKFVFVLNLFRVLGGCITLTVYTTVWWSGALMVLYEILPSINFQKDCLAECKVEASKCGFKNHGEILQKFRELQVLNNIFNEIYQRDYFGLCMASFLLVIICTGYFLITLKSVSPIVLLLGFYRST